MIAIYKYPIEITDHQVIEIPKSAKLLSVQVQYGYPCIWAMVDTNWPIMKRHITIAGTGHDLSSRLMGKFIGTIQLSDGELIFHVFDGGE